MCMHTLGHGRQAHAPFVDHVEVAEARTGKLAGQGLLGNKGGVTIAFAYHGVALTFGLCSSRFSECSLHGRIDCHPRANSCESAPPVDKQETQLRLGHHAYDRSYGDLQLRYRRCNISIVFGGGDELLVLGLGDFMGGLGVLLRDAVAKLRARDTPGS